MFCENCGTKLEEGAKFCAECGTPTPTQTEAVTPEVAPEPEIVPEAEPTNEPPKKKKKKKKAPVIIAVILVVVMLLACLIPCIIAALTGVVGVGGAAVLGIFNSALGSVNLPTFDQSQLDSLLEGGFNAGTLDGSVEGDSIGGGLMSGTENNDDVYSEQIDEDNYFEHIGNTAITIGELTALPEYASWNEDGSLNITVNFINGYTFELYDICIECIRVYNANGELIAENELGYVFSLDGLKYHSADFTLGADCVYNWNSDITNITIEIDHNS